MMHEPTQDLSRRGALKLMAGVPFLPWIVSCGKTSSTRAPLTGSPLLRITSYKPIRAFEFVAMDAPRKADMSEMAKMSVRSSVTAHLQDGGQMNFPLSYRPFFTTGDMVPDGQGGQVLAGGYYDINNRPILDLTDANRRQFFSDAPDGSSLFGMSQIQVPGVKGKAVFAVVQFEYVTRDVSGSSRYGHLPSPIAVLTLDQNPVDGSLTLVKYHNVDTSGVHGLWITCGSSFSPWGTHLSSEEYEPDATSIADNAQFKAFSLNLYGDETKANPYLYGHLPEVTVNHDGTGSIVKHYCLGRISHELVQVLPDERTVIMGDDATNGGAFLFIADRPRDLSSGTLYAAKWLQKTAENGGSADLQWIKLGHATSDEILQLATTLKASDIIDVKTVDPLDASYTKIRFAGVDNWVKILNSQEKAMAFLETHRYAAMRGASLGFTKWEGTSFNAEDKVAYVAMASIVSSMVDGTTDIKVNGQKSGAIYQLNLKGGQKDSEGNAIDSEWVPVDMETIPELMGKDLPSADDLGNLADPQRIANPDNIKYSPMMRTLFIGEDSSMHVNNFLWAYNVDTKSLTRLLSCPSGAESTGLFAADEINGFLYIMSNFQHAGDWELTRDLSGHVSGGLHAKVYESLDPMIRANYKDRYAAAVGYLTAVIPEDI